MNLYKPTGEKWYGEELMGPACLDDLKAALKEHGMVAVPVQLIEFIESREHLLPIEDRHVLSLMIKAAEEGYD